MAHAVGVPHAVGTHRFEQLEGFAEQPHRALPLGLWVHRGGMREQSSGIVTTAVLAWGKRVETVAEQ